MAKGMAKGIKAGSLAKGSGKKGGLIATPAQQLCKKK